MAAGAAQAGKACDRIIFDLGSGMNYQKRGFLQLLTLSGKQLSSTALCSWPVRLRPSYSRTRTGYSASAPRLSSISKTMGSEVVILQQEEKIDPQQRFCQDLVEIMTSSSPKSTANVVMPTARPTKPVGGTKRRQNRQMLKFEPPSCLLHAALWLLRAGVH